MLLVQYIRNKKKQRIGVVCSDGYGRVGWSRCNFSKGDKFDKKMGLTIATGRLRCLAEGLHSHIDLNSALYKEWPKKYKFPHSIHSDIIKMFDRSQAYFSDIIRTPHFPPIS